MVIPDLWRQAEEMARGLLENTTWSYRKIALAVHKKYGVGTKSWVGDIAHKYGLGRKDAGH